MDVFWSTLIATLVGAIIAVLGSWLIFVLQQRTMRQTRLDAALAEVLLRVPEALADVTHRNENFLMRWDELRSEAVAQNTTVREDELREMFRGVRNANRADLRVPLAAAHGAVLAAGEWEYDVLEEVVHYLKDTLNLQPHGQQRALEDIDEILVEWRRVRGTTDTVKRLKKAWLFAASFDSLEPTSRLEDKRNLDAYLDDMVESSDESLGGIMGELRVTFSAAWKRLRRHYRRW